MKHIILVLFWFLLITKLTLSQSNLPSTYASVSKEFINLKPIQSSLIPDEGIMFKRDAALFDIKKGRVFKFPSVAGRDCAILFKGEGEFIFTPPTDVEKNQLKRFYNKETLREKFTTLFILFADSNETSIINELEFSTFSADIETKREMEFIIDFISDKDYNYFDTDFMRAFLEGDNNELFYAHIGVDKYEPIFFKISPYDNEEISLLKRRKTGYSTYRLHEIVNKFYRASKYSSNRPVKLKAADYGIENYKINVNLDKSLNLSANCEALVYPETGNRNWVELYLYHELVVDSVYINNEPAHFERAGSQLWIKRNEAGSTAPFILKTFYSGKLLEKDEFGWVGLKSSLYWYPKYGNRSRSFYDITFSTHKNYKIVSVGELLSTEEQGELITTRWMSKLPIRNASFNIGSFETYEFADEKNKVNVFISEAAHRKISSLLAGAGILSGSNMREKIGTDILASIQFYQNVFGEIPLKELNVTSIPYSHAEAFPGMVHLSWINYQGVNFDKSGELMRAHEVAHQWWGIGVDFETYHDQWLSEGFSEYSALWFVQTAFNDNKSFFTILDNWKELILNNRKYLFGSGQEAGPIWLGYRTQSSETKGDYDLIIYKKGAWVLHMLRNMLIDLNNMNEDKFKKMLSDYFKSFYGKKATTDDFKKVVDRYMAQDMSWFFNQYVYGTDIPKYRFSYKSEKMEDGQYKVTCRIVQEDVPDNFKMYIPIKIILKNDRFARLRLEVKEKDTVIILPPLPEKPEEIIFNDLNSVLCTVNYEKWK
jgi:hypothetical protein